MEWAKGGRPQRPWRPHGPSGPDGPRGLFIVFARHRRRKVIEAHHTYFLSRDYARKKSKKVKMGDQQKIKITKYDMYIREAKKLSGIL